MSILQTYDCATGEITVAEVSDEDVEKRRVLPADWVEPAAVTTNDLVADAAEQLADAIDAAPDEKKADVTAAGMRELATILRRGQ